jgi:hypothetical protein
MCPALTSGQGSKANSTQVLKMVFRVIDAMDIPNGGRLIRLRLQEGEALPIRQIRGGRYTAKSPTGEQETLRAKGLAMVGGRPSNARLARTGRIDLMVTLDENGDQPRVSTRWEVTGPI